LNLNGVLKIYKAPGTRFEARICIVYLVFRSLRTSDYTIADVIELSHSYHTCLAPGTRFEARIRISVPGLQEPYTPMI
jgi:hypothetical protein